MFSSTPIWSHRKQDGADSSIDSQAGSLISQDNSLDGSDQISTPAKMNVGMLQAAGLTPQLSRLLVRPNNMDEFQLTRLILQETINLTRAAIANGLILHDLNVDEYMIKLCDNSMYKPIRHFTLDPMAELMDGLDINGWTQEDLEPLDSLLPLDKNRTSVLCELATMEEETISWVGGESFINMSDGGHFSWVGGESFISTSIGGHFSDNDGDEIISIMGPIRTIDGSKHSVNSTKSLSQYVNELIQQSVELTGVQHEATTCCRRDNTKRKALSPPTVNQIQRAMKFQAVGDGGSPILRKRINASMKIKSPPSGGQFQSPVVGRIKKQKRRVSTPKRLYTPDKRQLLITSSFSPKPKTVPDGP